MKGDAAGPIQPAKRSLENDSSSHTLADRDDLLEALAFIRELTQ
jgi:hypothetical protein